MTVTVTLRVECSHNLSVRAWCGISCILRQHPEADAARYRGTIHWYYDRDLDTVTVTWIL